MTGTNDIWNARLRGRATGVAILLLQMGCASFAIPTEPSIEFTKVPPYGEGGPDKIDDIAGRVTGARPGQRVVVYAKSGVWWVQPPVNQTFVSNRGATAWKSQTHPGSAYAALLVTERFRPRLTTEALPAKGGAVLGVAVSEGSVHLPPGEKTVLFGGYEWHIRRTPNDPGGTHNDYDPANAWTDAKGFLHLRISGSPGHWRSAEVSLPRGLGYGTYRFQVRDVAGLEPSAVFAMTISDDNGISREMDIEMSRWGDSGAKNGQFVVQPYYIPANTLRFRAPAGLVTFMMQWGPGRAAFKAVRGDAAEWESPAVEQHVFTSGIPLPGTDSIHLNLYVFGGNPEPLRQGTEVIVEKFEYLP